MPVAGTTTLGTPTAQTETPAPVSAEPLKLDDLTLPEGLAKEGLEEFVALANDAKLGPKERSEALLGLYAKHAKELADAPFEAYKAMNEAWQTELKNDPEIGGAKLQSDVLPAVSKLIDTYGGDKLREVLNLTGAGNNPEMARFLYKVAKAFTESSTHVTGSPLSGAVKRPSAAEAMYPNLAKGT